MIAIRFARLGMRRISYMLIDEFDGFSLLLFSSSSSASSSFTSWFNGKMYVNKRESLLYPYFPYITNSSLLDHQFSLELSTTRIALSFSSSIFFPLSSNLFDNAEMCSNALSIVASLFLLVISVSVNVFGVYEGDFCQLEDGSEGVCKKLTDCPSRIQEVMDGERDASSSGRCGFDESNEIVCCSFVTGQRLSPRPADAACQQYKNKVTNLGPKNINIKYYVFGGTPARSKDFPFTVALGYLDNNTLPIKYVCGGSLISSRHVLTAAHCVNNVNENVPVEVRLGNEDVTSNTSDVQRIGINDIIIHPQYKRTKFYNDVAILKLEKEIQLSTTVKPICLETNPLSSINTPVRANLIVLGWGVTTFAGDPSNRLMRTPSLSFVDKEECNKYYTGFKKLPNGVDDNLICAVDENKTRGSDACQGDSGGPLVISTGDGHRLIGVSAFGQGCGGSVPGVYTAIYSYLNWIEEHVW